VDIAKRLQTLVSSTTLIVCRGLVVLENQFKWAWK